MPCMSSEDGEPLSREGRPRRGRGGGRSDAASPRKGGGPPCVLLMGLSSFVRPRTADRGQLASLSLPAPHCVPCLPLRPTSEEALKWGESLEKLLLHKCEWGPPGPVPSPCPLPRPPLPGLGPPGPVPSPCLSPVVLSSSPRLRERIWPWRGCLPPFPGPSGVPAVGRG